MTDIPEVFLEISSLVIGTWLISWGMMLDGAANRKWTQFNLGLMALFVTTLAILYRLAGGG